jgi:hypothetical protein
MSATETASSGSSGAAAPPALRWFHDLLISMAIGAAVGGLIGLEDPRGSMILYVSLSSFTGLLINFPAWLLFWLLKGRIARMTGPGRIAARTALLAVSGLIAWTVMHALAVRLLHVHFGQHIPIYLALTAGLAIAGGFAFYGFDVIRSRLLASAARVTEVEFAEKELQLARELQSRLLPPPEIAGDGYRVAARNLAARLVAGDFYDSFLLPDGAVGVAVGDVAGKGMAAALIMASVKAMLPLIAAERSAAETLRELNRRLAAELPAREFVALAFARFAPAAGRVEIANAGLPDPYLMAAGRAPAPQVVPGPRLPLGVRREVDYLSLTLRLEPGDRLLLLTDGLAEAPAGGGEPLGYAALAELLAAAGAGGGVDAGESPLAWIDDLIERVRAATRPVLEDDWTVLVLERGRSAAPAFAVAAVAAG